MKQIKDANDLKREYYAKHPDGHFFDRDTLKFFGESMSQMRLLKGTVEVTDILSEKHTCYVLSSLQRKHPCGPRRTRHYFDVETLDAVAV